jgi:hypothetical protein
MREPVLGGAGGSAPAAGSGPAPDLLALAHLVRRMRILEANQSVFGEGHVEAFEDRRELQRQVDVEVMRIIQEADRAGRSTITESQDPVTGPNPDRFDTVPDSSIIAIALCQFGDRHRFTVPGTTDRVLAIAERLGLGEHLAHKVGQWAGTGEPPTPTPLADVPVTRYERALLALALMHLVAPRDPLPAVKSSRVFALLIKLGVIDADMADLRGCVAAEGGAL